VTCMQWLCHEILNRLLNRFGGLGGQRFDNFYLKHLFGLFFAR